MCLAPVVASALGTHAIPFNVILPSTCRLYPKDKHRLGATLPAAAILGTPSGFPLVCTPCLRLPGHSWEQPWAEFLQGNARVERGSESQVPWTGKAVYKLPCQVRQRELRRRNWLSALPWPHVGCRRTLNNFAPQRSDLTCLDNVIYQPPGRPAQLLPRAIPWAPVLMLLQQVWEASPIRELSSLAEDVWRGHLHCGVETCCDNITHRGAWVRMLIQEQKQEGRAPCGRSWVLYFSLDFVVKFSTPWQSQLRMLDIRKQVCETGQTACDNFQSLCPMDIFPLLTAFSPQYWK